MKKQHNYPSLADFLGGWFHQDFDIEGETLPEVVASYRKTSAAAERLSIVTDIQQFLAANLGTADAAFIQVFNPDIDPAGFGKTARDWLSEIALLLKD